MRQKGRRSFFYWAAAIFITAAVGCGKNDGSKNVQAGAADGSTKSPAAAGKVVLFTSLDRIFSEPIVKEFERRFGIRVEYVTDTEAVKTVGLFNRLLQRKDNPEADVFWNNEISRTLVLKEKGVLEKYVSPSAADIPPEYCDEEGYWTGFAARGRVILYNTNKVKPEEAPKTLADLVKPIYKGRVVIALPLFGTTATHADVLFETWGPEKAQKWFLALLANECRIAKGNAMARNLVQDGEADICLTDTDDANESMLKNKPVVMLYPDQEEGGLGALLIPNTLAMIRGGPNPENAKKLIDFVLSAEVEGLLAKSESAQMPVRPDVPSPNEMFDPTKVRKMRVDWPKAAQRHAETEKFIRDVFVR
jgi:iron(III) transport system substrate-binding protein